LSAEQIVGFIERIPTRLLQEPKNVLRLNLGSIDDLASSIRNNGLLHPIVVRQSGRRYEIVAGNRRFAACKSLGWKVIPCHIVGATDQQAFELALTENIQHRTMDTLEECYAFKKYVDELGYGGVSRLAERIGKSEQYVSERLQIIRLSNQVLTRISKGELNLSQARELVTLDPKLQNSVAEFATEEGASSREIKRLVSRIKSSEDQEKANHRRIKAINEEFTFDKCALALRICLFRMDQIIEGVGLQDSSSELRKFLLSQRVLIHNQIDIIIREKQMKKNSYFKYFHTKDDPENQAPVQTIAKELI
jgi:ParB family chromosome partitioning protein